MHPDAMKMAWLDSLRAGVAELKDVSLHNPCHRGSSFG